MRHVTVLIDLRGILGDVVVEVLRNAYGADDVGEVPYGITLAEAVDQSRPQVAITAVDPDVDPALPPPDLTRLLADHPQLRVLVVEAGGRSGSLWELRPARMRLGELSPLRLLQAIDGLPAEG